MPNDKRPATQGVEAEQNKRQRRLGKLKEKFPSDKGSFREQAKTGIADLVDEGCKAYNEAEQALLNGIDELSKTDKSQFLKICGKHKFAEQLQVLSDYEIYKKVSIDEPESLSDIVGYLKIELADKKRKLDGLSLKYKNLDQEIDTKFKDKGGHLLHAKLDFLSSLGDEIESLKSAIDNQLTTIIEAKGLGALAEAEVAGQPVPQGASMAYIIEGVATQIPLTQTQPSDPSQSLTQNTTQSVDAEGAEGEAGDKVKEFLQEIFPLEGEKKREQAKNAIVKLVETEVKAYTEAEKALIQCVDDLLKQAKPSSESAEDKASYVGNLLEICAHAEFVTHWEVFEFNQAYSEVDINDPATLPTVVTLQETQLHDELDKINELNARRDNLLKEIDEDTSEFHSHVWRCKVDLTMDLEQQIKSLQKLIDSYEKIITYARGLDNLVTQAAPGEMLPPDISQQAFELAAGSLPGISNTL